MKKLAAKGYYILAVIFLILGVTLSASAQYSGVNLETGGLYTALAKDIHNNLYVTRVTPGTSGATYEVEKYTTGSGTPTVIYTGLTHQVGDYPWGLAVTSTGNVFISTDFTTASGQIIELTNAGGGDYNIATYQTGRYFTALAVDASDNLYTTEYDAAHTSYAVVKYPANSASDAAGTNLYDLLKSAVGYAYPTGLAVASNGDVYVADAFSNIPTITDGGHVYKLTAASSYAVSTVSTGNYSSALALDANGNLYSSENRGSGYCLIEYANAAGAGVPVFNGMHTNGIYYPWGISIFSSSKIFVADGDDGTNGGAVIRLSFTAPTVTTNAATSATAASATLNGLVNDNGHTTTVNFIYGTSATLTGATTQAATTGGTINAGSGNTAAALTVTGLNASTIYYYAVSATNLGGTTQGAILNFITPPAISYNSPKRYNSGETISPLSPLSSTVPAPAYGSPVIVGSGFSTPFGVAADVSGNVYVADYGNEAIKKIPAGGGPPVTLLTGFTTGLGVAVDAAGNIYVADAGNATINEYPAGTTTPVAMATGFGSPYGIAVDAKGNIYVADYANNAVDKIPAGGGTPVAIGAGFATPTGVAVDAAGNVYVADFGNKLVKEIQINGGATVSIGSGFNDPVGVGVDPVGNVFVADYGGSAVYEIPTGGGTPIALGSGYASPTGVAIDGFGKLYVANYLASNIEQLTPVGGYYLSMALPAGLAFSGATGVISGDPTTVSAATNYTVTAYNAGGGTSAIVNIDILANANLSALKISSGTLTPAFANGTTSYTAGVTNAISSITVTPTTSDPDATVTVNGTAVTSGTVSAAIPLNAGPNTITTIVTAQDGTTTKTYTVTVTRAPSSEAYLANLTLQTASLSPSFAYNTLSYTASVANGTTSVTVTPTTSDANATVTVNGTAVTNKTASGPIALSVGANPITIVVTAQDGVTTKTYTVTVTRAPSSDAHLTRLVISSGTLSPAFSYLTTNYTASVNTATITVTPTTGDANATVTINGTTVASNAASKPINLATGTNTITTIVTAQDGTTTDTYTITVTRLSAVATLSALKLSSGALSPAFASGTAGYTASVTNATSSITVTPTTGYASATVKINGTAVANKTASGAIALSVGANTITIVVTAQDGVTKQTYTVTVTRAPSSEAYLATLTVHTASLSPSFAYNTLSYTAGVAHGVTSVTVTPAVIDLTATVTVNGATVANKTASGAIVLSVGANPITIVVTAQDGVTRQTYTVTVTRAPSSEAYLASLTLQTASLSPSFAYNTLSYTASVANSISSIMVTPAVVDLTATVKVNGTAVANKTASGPVMLSVGANPVTVVVTAQDGVTKQTYTVTVTRAAPGDNNVYEPVSMVKPDEEVTLEDDGIMVHQALSPNGDGINDFLTIDNITSYPDNHLMIMNRNGMLVYEAKGYDNSARIFDGHSNKTGQMQLPGTYFYSLDYTVKGIAKHKTGFIVLKY